MGKGINHEKVYQAVLKMRERKLLYKAAHSKVREKLFPLNYEQLGKVFGISHEMVHLIVKKFEGVKKTD